MPEATRGRPKGTGTRAGEALQIVTAKPGVTISEIATALGIKANYLYRVLPDLEGSGHVRKEGAGWYPVPGAGPLRVTPPSAAPKSRKRERSIIGGPATAQSNGRSVIETGDIVGDAIARFNESIAAADQEIDACNERRAVLVAQRDGVIAAKQALEATQAAASVPSESPPAAK